MVKKCIWYMNGFDRWPKKMHLQNAKSMQKKWMGRDLQLMQFRYHKFIYCHVRARRRLMAPPPRVSIYQMGLWFLEPARAYTHGLKHNPPPHMFTSKSEEKRPTAPGSSSSFVPHGILPSGTRNVHLSVAARARQVPCPTKKTGRKTVARRCEEKIGQSMGWQ